MENNGSHNSAHGHNAPHCQKIQSVLARQYILHILLVIATNILLETSCTNKRADQGMTVLNHVNSLFAVDSIH